MKKIKKCSHEGCSRNSWWPPDKNLHGHKSFCIFHSPLLDQKKKYFKEAWESFLNNVSVDSRTVDSINCSGFLFPIQINLNNFNVTGKADFSNTLFLKNASFEKTQFEKADFSGAWFARDAFFNKTTFKRFAKFNNTEFSRKADFGRSQFLLPLLFCYAHFSGPANFKKTRFTSTSFDHADFLGSVNFNHAMFLNEADFRNVRFNGNAHFTNAVFKGKAIFDDVLFSSFGFFSDVNFSGTSISFSPRPHGLSKKRTTPFKPPFSTHFSLLKTWNMIQKWHLKFKNSTI